MAKNKKRCKGHAVQAHLSPERFMREKVRTLPIGKCFITSNWQETGLSQIIISRVRPSGNLVVGIFLVDTFCIGVKDVDYYVNMPESEFNDLIMRFKSGLDEISYNEAHNIIYGAIGFAADGGIQPAKDFRIAGYILEEDTEDIPLIEYEFGKNGKHFLIMNRDKSEMPYLRQLEKTLDDDFELAINYDDDEESEDRVEDWDGFCDGISGESLKRAMNYWEEIMAESVRLPMEVYSYKYPEYPKSLNVKNQFIADELLSKDNCYELPKAVIERILALPHDEAAEDISNVVMYEIGRTYKSINDKTIGTAENDAILHSLFLLTQLKSEKGLDAVLEIMRQNIDFADYHLGDLAAKVLHPALYACGKNRIQEIEDYLNQPGLETYLKGDALDALTMIVFRHPERREEIIEVFRKLLKSWLTKIPKREACDGCLAGWLMGDLIDLEAKELIPEIEAVFEIDCVDKSLAGDCNKVLDKIQNGGRIKDLDKYKFPDIYEQYAHLKSFQN